MYVLVDIRCDQFNIPITAEISKRAVASYRASKGKSSSQSTSSKERPEDIREYSYEAFVDAITQFIIADDQSLNVIESPHLRRIFLLLRQDLKDSDIPHRTTIRNHVKEIWDEHLKGLEEEIKIGWVTLDNASNNDTFMVSLERELRAHGIPFDHTKNRIR
ncbi:hypothetical protein K443DRAFT_133552 [Laccaria amethystina LaAM-08-1]|uniref:Uncharacterized protein n=1 Tax=Laccaria amethystina LaAM-08-1 TaxID=1095629 RepID=A0A0C9WMG5_9AGAR|nr:hypothetical protein K443DRAFT_133552 [Laccaria amethystina LaAM-08-1]